MAMGKWKESWSNTKDAFTEISGDKKKPDAGTFLKVVSTHKSGVASSLKDADAAYAVYTAVGTAYGNKKAEEADVHKALTKFGLAVKDAKKSIAEYGKVLDAAIKKLADRDDKDLRYRALKTMTRSLAAIEAEMELGQQELFGKFQLDRERLEREGTGKAKMTSDEMVKISTDPMIGKSLLAGCAKMLTFVAHCKGLVQKDPANLTGALKFYNDGIQKAARDLTQPLGNVEKRLEMSLPREVKAAFDDCVKRNTGSFKLDATTDARAYVIEIKLLSGHAKEAADWGKKNLS